MSWRERVTLELGDLAQVDTEAVVNAANTQLWMTSGVAAALKRAGGESVELEAVSQGPVNVGEAVLTSGGELPALYVIHAVVMEPERPASEAAVKAAASAALQLALEQEIESISLPALGTGVGGMDFPGCARAIFHAIADHAARHSQPEEIRVVLFGENALREFQAVLAGWDMPLADPAGLADLAV